MLVSLEFNCVFQKRWVSIGLGFVTVVLITVLYVDSSAENYSTSFSNYVLHRFNDHSQLSRDRILCLILTSPKNFLTKTIAVNKTWAQRCDGYFFITESPSDNLSLAFNISKQLPIASIKNITAGYEHLTQKSVLAFLFAYEHHFNDFDWFIKADDDTYLFVDNLRTFLSDKNSSDPVTFGYNFKVIFQYQVFFLDSDLFYVFLGFRT